MLRQLTLPPAQDTEIGEHRAAQAVAQQAVYATVAYADIFDMPIERDRAHHLLIGPALTAREMTAATEALLTTGRIEFYDGLLCLRGRAKIITEWNERHQRATRVWQDAEHWAQVLGRVPFVRMVAVTGGLALDSLGAHERISFFIVTRPRRLWMTRRMIQLVVRAAERSGVSLCPQHLVTMRAFEMPDQSVHTARELAQMCAVVGDEVCQTVRRSNPWMFDILGNATVTGNQDHVSNATPTAAQRFVEGLLLMAPFKLVELWEKRHTIRRLAAIAQRIDPTGDLERNFSTDVCNEFRTSRTQRIEAAWNHRRSNASPRLHNAWQRSS